MLYCELPAKLTLDSCAEVHTFGERYKGVGIGNFGDASIFSFYATKVFNSIEGGCVCYRDTAYGDKLYNLKNFGIKSQEVVEAVGANAKNE